MRYVSQVGHFYHPQTNDLLEPRNRTVTDMLSMYIFGYHSEWAIALPLSPLPYLIYDLPHHETAGYSTYDLLFRRDPLLAFDTALPSASTHS